MRILGIHSDNFYVKSGEKAIDGAEPLKDEEHEIKIDRECLVVYISVEEPDEKSPESVAYQLVEDIRGRSKRLNVKLVVLYPYVHLTEEPSRPMAAIKTLGLVYDALADELEVVKVPFGWYKAFKVSCKGHPLSEWSARYLPGEEGKEKLLKKKAEKTRKGSEFVRWVIVDNDGVEHEVTPENYRKSPIFKNKGESYQLLKQFVSNELGSGEQSDSVPKHIGYMQQHELVDYCDVSEKGHYKWYPKGLLIQKLILDYAGQMAKVWGALEMKNPVLIKGDSNVVGELMGEFHERDYQVDGGRGICYLRYASDPLGFPFMQKVRFSHRQSPLKVYEEATCFRNEQEGEVSGLKRVRNFMMTDMHAACASEAEALAEFEALSLKFAELMNHLIARSRWVLGWEGTVDFYENNKDYLIGIGRKIGVPAFFKLMPEMSHYYAIKNEFQSITEDKSNIQISTVQWDVKDGERFNIGYIDEDGKKHPCPVILHASSFGSIERTLCVILENIAIDARKGSAPMFPYWLAPTQVRVLPVSEKFTEFGLELCDKISGHNVRCDIDDREDTVGKKIRNGEKNWIPYLLVVGQKEMDSGLLTVRSRKDKSQKEMRFEEFVQLLKEELNDMPFRSLPTPRLVSQSPIFFG
jgi:threonyl-tRNA synthetase